MDNNRLEKICISREACITPLGSLAETVDSLMAGVSAVCSDTRFGPELSLAPFADPAVRSPQRSAQNLLAQTGSLLAYNSETTLFIFAAAKGDLSELETPEGTAEKTLLPFQAEQYARFLGLERAERICISNACASGTAAVDTACDYLNAGLYKYAVIAGFDTISEFTASGFHALGALSPSGALPFDQSRTGMSLGEGAALLVLEKRVPHSREIIVAGSALSNDANHRTGPSRDGSGLAEAIISAAERSGISADRIGAVKCHGTATPYNDAMEAKALFTVFGNRQPPAVSLKGSIGHLSGAGSLVETILAAEFLRRKMIPGTWGFCRSDCEEPIRISSRPQRIESPVCAVLAAGFGGLNSCLILEEIQ